MYRSGLVDTLVTHANMKGLGLTPLFGDRRGFMPPQLKTNILYIPLSKKSTVNSLKRLLMSLSVGMWWTKALTLKLLLFDLSISFFRHSSRFSVGEMIFFLGLGFCKHVCGAWYFIFVSFSSLDDVEFDSC